MRAAAERLAVGSQRSSNDERILLLARYCKLNINKNAYSYRSGIGCGALQTHGILSMKTDSGGEDYVSDHFQ